MSSFPVIASTLSPEHLLTIVKNKYGLKGGATCRLFRTGINHTYFIFENETKYVLRVYSFNWRTETEILEELRYLNLLRENSINVSHPILDSENNYIQKIEAPEGLRYAVVFLFAEGEKKRDLSENNCQIIGSMMAQMHKVSISQAIDRIGYDPITLTQLPYQYAGEYFPRSMKEMEFINSASRRIEAAFNKVDLSQMRWGVVHLDIWYDNISIDGDSNVTLFDFDFCGNGWLILDVSYFVMQLFHTEPDKSKFELKMAEFLKGYENVTPLSEEEKRIIPLAGLAIWIFYLGVQSQRFDNWSNIFLTENYLNHYIGMVKNWLDYHNTEIPTV